MAELCGHRIGNGKEIISLAWDEGLGIDSIRIAIGTVDQYVLCYLFYPRTFRLDACWKTSQLASHPIRLAFDDPAKKDRDLFVLGLCDGKRCAVIPEIGKELNLVSLDIA